MVRDSTLSVDSRGPCVHEAGHQEGQKPQVHGAGWFSSFSLEGTGEAKVRRTPDEQRWAVGTPSPCPEPGPSAREAAGTGWGKAIVPRGTSDWPQLWWGHSPKPAGSPVPLEHVPRSPAQEQAGSLPL